MIKSHRSKSWRADPEADRLSGTAAPRAAYIQEDSGVLYGEGRDEHEKILREARKRVRREHYAKNVSDVRDKQRAYLRKRRRERGAAPRRKRAPNSTLDNMLTGAFGEPTAWGKVQ